jgi:hypothetical protein
LGTGWRGACRTFRRRSWCPWREAIPASPSSTSGTRARAASAVLSYASPIWIWRLIFVSFLFTVAVGGIESKRKGWGEELPGSRRGFAPLRQRQLRGADAGAGSGRQRQGHPRFPLRAEPGPRSSALASLNYSAPFAVLRNLIS